MTAFLRKNGIEAEQICYDFSSRPFMEKTAVPAPVPQKPFFSRFVSRCIRSFRYRFFEKPRNARYEDYKRNILPLRAEAFSAFQNIITHSDVVYVLETVVSAADRYDCLIAGSDQVWNFDWFNPAFFLDLPACHARRLAYAASAGRVMFCEDETAYLRRTLPRFDAVSVREKDLADVLNEMLETDRIVQTVDPTLLLSADEWGALASPRLLGKKYLFCYYLHNDSSLSDLARKAARKYRLKIATIPFPGIEYNQEDIRFGTYRFDAASPADFLSLIRHAEYILTDSFHATVFSLLFGKRFVAFPREDANQMGGRLKTLTELFGCPERFCQAAGKDRALLVSKLLEQPLQSDPIRIRQKVHDSETFLLNELGKE